MSHNIVPPILEQYYARHCDRIVGWLHTVSKFILPACDEWQQKNGITGPMAEIGIYEGKTLAVLCLLAREHERVVGVDIELREKLKPNLAEIGITRMPTLVIQDSLTLKPDDLIAAGDNRKYRLVHVDGHHTYKNALNDLRLAFNVVSADGIVALDDFFSATVPGVSQALCELLVKDETVDFVPFALGGAKAYLAHRNNADELREYVFDRVPLKPMNADDLDVFFGRRVAIYDLY